MNPNRIMAKEFSRRKETKYLHSTMEKPKGELEGETVEQFLARGGKINKVMKQTTPGRDATGKFLKKTENA